MHNNKKEQNKAPSNPSDQHHEALPTYSVREILSNFVSEETAANADKLFDLDNYTAKNLMSRSVSFGAWVCLLPIICTCSCIKKVFRLQISVI